MIYTTGNLARQKEVCDHIEKMFIKYSDMDEPMPLIEILDVCGLDDMLWCLRCSFPEKERDIISRTFACDCVEHISSEYKQILDVARKFTLDEATLSELLNIRTIARRIHKEKFTGEVNSIVDGTTLSVIWSTLNNSWGAALAVYMVIAKILPEEEEWQIQRIRELLNGY